MNDVPNPGHHDGEPITAKENPDLKTAASTTEVTAAPGFIGTLKELYTEFSDDDVMTQAAALAFYTGLAIAPLLTLAVWVMRLVAGDAAKQRIVEAFGEVIGAQAAAPIKSLLDPASAHASSSLNLGAVISLVILIVSASGVFVQLQAALNVIWDVKQKAGNGLITFVKARLVSIGMLFTLIFLLMVSLVLSAALQGFVGLTGAGTGIVLVVINNIFSVALFTALFAMLFRFVPDVKIRWQPVWVGALISALLFAAGKYALAFYLGRASYESSYGVAVGAFVALLTWVYYSAIILLIGAEATQVYARRHGERVEADEHAVRIVTQKVEV